MIEKIDLTDAGRHYARYSSPPTGKIVLDI
jgi:hypothetical protein